MATHNLTDQFTEMQKRINLGDRTRIARAAHLEVSSVLQDDGPLREHGVDPVLIGSYARHTAIWPGKDVDILGRLTRDTISTIDPGRTYDLFRQALAAYGARLVEQPRSLKIEFGPEIGQPLNRYLEAEEFPAHLFARINDFRFSFSVDVVPAVRWEGEEMWGIPQRDPQVWELASTQNRWVKTHPEELTAVTQRLNGSVEVHGQGAYVPTVKALKQVRKHHLDGTKPSFLFYEFILHDGFADSSIAGDSWPDTTHSALDYTVRRLQTLAENPVDDPVLGTPYRPQPTSTDVSHALSRLVPCRNQAAEALNADKCRAAYLWRQVLGSNGNEGHDSVFPLPEGCRSDGTTIGLIAANPLRGGKDERGFGTR